MHGFANRCRRTRQVMHFVPVCPRVHTICACLLAAFTVTSPEFPLTLAQPDPASQSQSQSPAESEEEPVCSAPPLRTHTAHCCTIHQIGVVHHVCRQVVPALGRVRHLLYTDSGDHRGYLNFIRRVSRLFGQSQNTRHQNYLARHACSGSAAPTTSSYQPDLFTQSLLQSERVDVRNQVCAERVGCKAQPSKSRWSLHVARAVPWLGSIYPRATQRYRGRSMCVSVYVCACVHPSVVQMCVHNMCRSGRSRRTPHRRAGIQGRSRTARDRVGHAAMAT